MVTVRMKALLALLIFFMAVTQGWALGSHEPKQQDDLKAEDSTHDLWVYRQSLALGIPEEELSALASRCQEEGFTTGEVRRVLALIAKAKLAGLPHGDLLAKLREGLAKGASPEIIYAALSDKAKTLRRAKGLADTLIMEGWGTPDLDLAVKVMADALDFGVSPQELLGIIRGDVRAAEGMPDVSGLFKLIVIEK
ncbi:MAG: hypothetical protein C0609_06885 [Deltaproteobacteria bacterium]|nr:MAG: hypothetical protein C0609_06885 [Deltaproteobacteria bacterium]